MAVQKLEGSKKAVMTGFLLMLFLIFLYQFSFGVVGTLNHHFQSALHVSALQSTFLEVAFFIGYFVAPLPAAFLMQKFGYKSGIVLGLCLYVIGSLVFIPATSDVKYWIFLLALFILAIGAASIESGADPYITVLGPPEHGLRRINLGQAFGGLGQFIAPFLAALFFYSSVKGATSAQAEAIKAHNAHGFVEVYLLVAIISVIALVVTLVLKIPDIRGEEKQSVHKKHFRYLLARRHFVWGVVAQFCYLAAQIGMYSFFVDYLLEHWGGLTPDGAMHFFEIALLLFMIGRFGTTGIMYITKLEARALQFWYMVAAIILLIPVILGLGKFSVICLVISFFFISIAYPTNFGLATKDLGKHTKRASSIIIMSVSGGAVGPLIMGVVIHFTGSYAVSFIVPVLLFVVGAVYAKKGCKVIPYPDHEHPVA